MKNPGSKILRSASAVLSEPATRMRFLLVGAILFLILQPVDVAWADQSYGANLQTCLSGKYVALCNHSILSDQDAARTRFAEYAANLATCLTGKYVALCNHSILSDQDATRTRTAEYTANLETCLVGKYVALCNHSILSDQDASRTRTAEYKANLEVCLSGKYVALCNHPILSDQDAERTRAAEYAVNLAMCNDGRYPALCNRALLVAGNNRPQIAAAPTFSGIVQPAITQIRTEPPVLAQQPPPLPVPSPVEASTELHYPKPMLRPDDVAVVIGNKLYRNSHVPTVEYAQRDADAVDRYLIDILGYRADNIINLRDASQAEMEAVLGNSRTVQGRLWQLVKQGKSNVTVYFSGHGAPGQQDHKGYLLPADADPEKPEINGFPIELLLDNLSKLGATTTTVYIDACFSGDTPKGTLISAASGIFIVPKEPIVPAGVIVLTAGRADQVASWDSHNHHGLFTEYLLDGLYGKADLPPYGNGDGKITGRKLKAYLDDVMTYAARREYGRTQTVSLYGDEKLVLVALPGGKPIPRQDVADSQRAVPIPAVQVSLLPPHPIQAPPRKEAPAASSGSDNDALYWSSIKDSRKGADFEAYLLQFPKGAFVAIARSRIEDLSRPQTTATAAPPSASPIASPSPPPLPAGFETVMPQPAPTRPSFFARIFQSVYFDTAQAAGQACPGDIVVWVNKETGVYHYPGRRWYGRTKDGAYMCESSRDRAGARPAANGQ